MNPDEYQQAWQAHASQTRVVVDTDFLLQEMRRSHRRFESMILRRDLLELAVALILLPVWFVMGFTLSLPWTWYLTVPVLTWVIGFTLVDRRRHSRRPTAPGAPLLDCARQSLAQVEHQIWLLRNVGWWYLLPLAVSIMAFVVDTSLAAKDSWWEFVLVVAGFGIFLLALYGAIYFINQVVVRTQFEPRRSELLRLIDNLEDDGTSDNSPEVVDMVFGMSDPPTRGANNWNHVISSWRTAAAIILPTLCGAVGGLLFPLDEFGPVLFQSVVGAVVAFEISLGFVWVRHIRRQKSQSLEVASDQERPNPPWAPAIAILSLLLILSCLAVLVLYQFHDDFRGPDQTIPEEPGSVNSATSAGRLQNISAFDETDVAHLDQWLRRMQEAFYPGLSVAIVHDGETVYLGAAGFEDLRTEHPATPQSQYYVSGVTKAVTGTLAVILHERGVVDLDEPVLNFLPAHISISTTPDRGGRITLRQLAAHTSGLPRRVPGPVQSIDEWYQLEPRRLYDHLAGVTLNADPGTAAEYSNLGYGLLGHALERAAGRPFDQLVTELICQPLQLEKTAVPVDDTLHPATGYARRNHRETKSVFRSRMAGSGGLVSTAEELAVFVAAQMRAGVFTQSMLDVLHTEAELLDGSQTSCTPGWNVRSGRVVDRILMQNGRRSNCCAWIGFAPEHAVGVVVMTNCGGPSVDPIGYEILNQSIPLTPEAPEQ